ncbi:hypothetical protein ACX80D_05940 [Arthrobacter sp. Sr24]
MSTETRPSLIQRTGIYFKNSVLYFGRKWWCGIVVGILVVALAIFVNVVPLEKWQAGTANGILIFIGGVVGILFAPTPKPVNHVQTASASVLSLLDMKTNSDRAQTAITEVASELQVPSLTIRLVAAQDLLLQQEIHYARTIENWNTVAPGVVDRVVFDRSAGSRRLRQLEANEGNTNE